MLKIRPFFTILLMLLIFYLTFISFNAPYKEYPLHKDKHPYLARVDITAEDDAFNIDNIEVFGQDKIILEKGPPSPDLPVFAIIKHPASENWQSMIISFRAKGNGYLRITLKNAWTEDMQQRHRSIMFDDIELLSHDLVQNGGFEDSENSQPTHWTKTFEKYIQDPEYSHMGNCSVKVWHDQLIDQSIPVKAGTTYYLKVYFKAALQ